MDIVLDAGANDLTVEDGVAEIWADPEFFEPLIKVFEEKGIKTDEAEVIRRPEMGHGDYRSGHCPPGAAPGGAHGGARRRAAGDCELRDRRLHRRSA